jgi:hypothetical protein
MAGHLLFNSGSNESSPAPQFKWLDNTFKYIFLDQFYSKSKAQLRIDLYRLNKIRVKSPNFEIYA